MFIDTWKMTKLFASIFWAKFTPSLSPLLAVVRLLTKVKDIWSLEYCGSKVAPIGWGVGLGCSRNFFVVFFTKWQISVWYSTKAWCKQLRITFKTLNRRRRCEALLLSHFSYTVKTSNFCLIQSAQKYQVFSGIVGGLQIVVVVYHVMT